MKKVLNKIKRIIFRKKYNRKRAIKIFIGIIVLILIVFSFSISKSNEWVQNGNEISNGNESYIIGSYYDYDESKNGKYELPDVKWKVLGAEDGNLLVVSSSSVESITLGDKKDIKKTQDDYINGNILLDEISEKYAKGKNAVSSRNITINDILKLTNIDESLIYNEAEYTYYWNSNKEPNYTSLNEGNGTFKIPHKNNFYWFDKEENKWNNTYKQEGNITTIINDLHKFDNKIYDENQRIIYDVQKEIQIYNMLFLNDNGQTDSYWVNNKYIDATKEIVSYGYNVIKANSLNYEHLIQSNGTTNKKEYGAKIVIAID